MRPLSARRSRAGYSLLEVVLSVGLLAVVLGYGATVQSTSFRAHRETSQRTDLDSRLRRALDRVAQELAGMGAATAFPALDTAFGSDEVNFRRPAGLAGGVVVWGDLQRLSFEYDTGEVDDGLDNDGDGLVDEGALVLTRNPGAADEVRVVLCHDVRELLQGELAGGGDDNGNGVTDERGFNVHRVDDVLTIRITLEELDARGDPLVRTLETSVRLRN